MRPVSGDTFSTKEQVDSTSQPLCVLVSGSSYAGQSADVSVKLAERDCFTQVSVLSEYQAGCWLSEQFHPVFTIVAHRMRSVHPISTLRALVLKVVRVNTFHRSSGADENRMKL